jgi:hypothetical protein
LGQLGQAVQPLLQLVEEVANDNIYTLVDQTLQQLVGGLGLIPNIRANIPKDPLLLA